MTGKVYFEDDFCKVYNLIHSLTKNEKGYIKKYSKIYVSSKASKQRIYYEVLSKMKVYNKVLERKLLEEYYEFKSFKNVKNELYSNVLELLVLLRSEKFSFWNYLLEHMKMLYLYQKGMYNECIDYLQKLKTLKEDDSSVISNLLYWRYSYLYFDQLSLNAETLNDAEHFEKKYNESVEQVVLESMVHKAIFNFSRLRIKEFNKPRQETLKALDLYEKEYIYILPKAIVTENIKLLSAYYYCKISFYLLIEDEATCDFYTEKYLNSFNLSLSRKFIHEYVNAILFRIHFLLKVKKFNECYELLRVYEKDIIKPKNMVFNEVYIYAIWCVNSLYLFLKNNDSIKLKTFLDENLERYKSFSRNINVRFYVEVDLNFAKALALNKEYKKANYFLSKILDNNKIGKQFDNLLCSAKILDMMVHFDMGNFESNIHFINSFYIKMKKNKLMIAFDKIFFREFIKLNNKGNLVSEKDILSFIEIITDNLNIERLESYISKTDFIEWLKAKI